MRIEQIGEKFVVARGDENRPQHFSFFVDGTGSSWTKFSEFAHKHVSRDSAQETLRRLQWRQRERRREKQEGSL